MRRLLLAIPFWLALASCSGSELNSNTGGAGGNAGASTGSGGMSSSNGGATAVKCDAGPGYSMPVEAQELASVSATLVDVDGAPVVGELLEVCGVDLCSPPARTDKAGHVVMSPATPLLEKKPAAKFGEGILTPRFAILLPRERVIDLGVLHTVLLPPLPTNVPLLAGTSATSSGLTLLPPAGSKISIDELTYESGDEQGFRAVRVPNELVAQFADASLGLEVVYGATPVDTQFCPPAKLQIENSESWEPNTNVEVLLHGVAIEEEFAPYGGWAKVSDARVSADGTLIETTSPGLPVLGVIGLRRK